MNNMKFRCALYSGKISQTLQSDQRGTGSDTNSPHSFDFGRCEVLRRIWNLSTNSKLCQPTRCMRMRHQVTRYQGYIGNKRKSDNAKSISDSKGFCRQCYLIALNTHDTPDGNTYAVSHWIKSVIFRKDGVHRRAHP